MRRAQAHLVLAAVLLQKVLWRDALPAIHAAAAPLARLHRSGSGVPVGRGGDFEGRAPRQLRRSCRQAKRLRLVRLPHRPTPACLARLTLKAGTPLNVGAAGTTALQCAGTHLHGLPPSPTSAQPVPPSVQAPPLYLAVGRQAPMRSHLHSLVPAHGRGDLLIAVVSGEHQLVAPVAWGEHVGRGWAKGKRGEQRGRCNTTGLKRMHPGASPPTSAKDCGDLGKGSA